MMSAEHVTYYRTQLACAGGLAFGAAVMAGLSGFAAYAQHEASLTIGCLIGILVAGFATWWGATMIRDETKAAAMDEIRRLDKEVARFRSIAIQLRDQLQAKPQTRTAIPADVAAMAEEMKAGVYQLAKRASELLEAVEPFGERMATLGENLAAVEDERDALRQRADEEAAIVDEMHALAARRRNGAVSAAFSDPPRPIDLDERGPQSAAARGLKVLEREFMGGASMMALVPGAQN
jgi:hypothetical protein